MEYCGYGDLFEWLNVLCVIFFREQWSIRTDLKLHIQETYCTRYNVLYNTYQYCNATLKENQTRKTFVSGYLIQTITFIKSSHQT
jgi:hypothetical protein